MIRPMKPLIAWVLLSFQLFGATGDPAQVAVKHLEKIRDGSINLEPGADTAIAPQTSEGKRAEIAQRVKRMALDLGRDPLAAGSSNIDGDLAAVLVGQCPGHDLDAYRVTAVALVRKSDVWLAAPLPGSFQNSGIPFDPATRERAKALEDWMIGQQAPELDKLRDQSLAGLRALIEKSLPPTERLSMTSAQCANRFFKACSEKDFPAITGLLGGGCNPLPDDWSQRLKAADQAVKAVDKAPRHWRLLMAPEVLRIRLEHEESGDRARIVLACLDPAGIPPKFEQAALEEITIKLVKPRDGPWIIDLPHEFLTQKGPDGDAPPAEPLDDSREASLCGFLAEQFPPAPAADPAKARDELLHAFRSGGQSPWVRMISPPDDGEAARGALEAAVSLWRTFCHPPSVHHAISLGDHGDGSHHGFVFQLFSILNPDQMDLRELHFVRTRDGWYWQPAPAEETLAEFRSWKALKENEWREQWRRALLDECKPLVEFSGTEAPSEEEARSLVERWMQALRAGDIRAAIRLTARLQLPDSGVTLLRNLGYEINAIRSCQHTPSVDGVYRSNPWALVRMKPAPENPAGCSCFPVVKTPDGPRILLETDLVASETRSRQYLNRMALRRLGKSDPGISGTLEKLFSTLSTAPKAAGGNPE